MSPDRICKSLQDAGHDASLTDSGSRLTVVFRAVGQPVKLVHTFPAELVRVPRFDLVEGHGFGKLAHVLASGDPRGEGGEVCIGDVASTSVNVDRPDLVYRDTLKDHVLLLTRLIEEPTYNRDERLREFDAHWSLLCRKGEAVAELYVVWDGAVSECLQVKPSEGEPGADIRSNPILLASGPAEDSRLMALRKWVNWGRRPTRGQGIGIRLDRLEPAPANGEELPAWYFESVGHADREARKWLERLGRKKSREFWVVLSGDIPDGRVLFAVLWRAKTKAGLPSSVAEAQTGQWTLSAYRVRSLSRGSLVPRGGGSLDLGGKSVLIVGCGSVGSEVAHRLTSAGVGCLTISDPDKFSEENLYRHTLSLRDIDVQKSVAVAQELALKHPWASVQHWSRRLEQLRNADVLREFDLVVVAIGSPTVERLFAAYCRKSSVGVPTINCWLEGYGIGGHAILVVPDSMGCWECAYVDQKTFEQGPASNLNFLAANQIVMRNHGGCGAQFLPFSGIAASQTATMTADLAVRFLSGEVTTSSRVSWQGSNAEVGRMSLATTYRYRRFKDSLKILPLEDPNCGVCDG